jgi:hypothetical protein
VWLSLSLLYLKFIELLGCVITVFHQIYKNLTHYSFQYFLCCFLSAFSIRLIKHMSVLLRVPQDYFIYSDLIVSGYLSSRVQPWKRTKCYHSLVNGWNWRTWFWVRLAWPKRPKIVCSPSYVDIRSRANTTRGLDFDHMIKVRAHKGGVRIGKTPKKLASICCP